jgi:hypothetical protein
VAAQPLSSCKNNGTDGNARYLGLGMNTNNSSVNANACIKGTDNTILLPEDRRNIIGYVAGDNAYLPEISASMARGTLSNLSAGPLIGIGQSAGGASNFEVSLDPAGITSFDFGNIIKVKNSRVAAFPDFLMDWATRQLEEIVNKLTSLPTLYVIFPDFTDTNLGDYKDFPKKFSNALSSGTDNKDQFKSLQSNSQTTNSTLQSTQTDYNSFITENKNTINSAGKNIS